MKKRYVIYYTGLFCEGYVKQDWTTRNRTVRFETIQDAFYFATKMRWQWFAKFWCDLLNKESTRKLLMKEFFVKEVMIT